MSVAGEFKYRGFISYSHRDTSWSRWVHRRLEGWRIDDDLVGRQTDLGPIPKSIGKFFRDREDFSAGQALGEQTLAVLQSSKALILLCSPASARSAMVNEEIRLFRWRYPDRPLVPLIIGGKPGDPEKECFVPALRFEVDPDGTITNRPCAVLAADATDDGDGRDLAMAKVVARLLGLGTDEVFRRAERERRRQARIRNVITAALAVLTVAAVIGAGVSWRELKTNESFLDATLKTTSGLVRSAVEQSKAQGASVASTTSLLKQTERLFADMRKFGRKTPELDLREALMRIDQSTNFRLIGQTDLALAQAQQASSIVARLGGAYAAAYARALIAHGEVLYETNQKRPAFDLFTQARTVALNAAKADPGNDDVQRSLIAAELRICEYELVDHRYVDARAVAQSALDRAERLVTRNIPDDPDARSDWLTDVFVKSRASSFLAETYQLDDQAAQALEFYGKALVTRKQLVAYAADNTRFRSSLADVHDKIGELLGQDKDKLAEAAANLSESVKIRRDLSSADRSNQEWLTRLASTLTSLGDIREAEGQLEQALALYEEALAVAGGVADHEPGNTTGLRERASAQVGIAGIHDKQHRSKLALDEYAVARKVIERLAAAAPDDKAWKDALAQIDGEIDRIRVETSGAPKTADTK